MAMLAILAACHNYFACGNKVLFCSVLRANTWHEFSDTLYFVKNFLFLASITSFTFDTLNSLIHSSTVSFNLMSNILRKQLSTTYWRDLISDSLSGHTSIPQHNIGKHLPLTSWNTTSEMQFAQLSSSFVLHFPPKSLEFDFRRY